MTCMLCQIERRWGEDVHSRGGKVSKSTGETYTKKNSCIRKWVARNKDIANR